MPPIRTRALHVMVLAAMALAPWASAADPEAQAKLIEERMEKAREQLDEAARKLAELHTEMWRLETSGPRSKRPMLGILVDDSRSEGGLVLAGVTPEGGAEEAGLRAGDRIVRVNGAPMNDDGRSKPLHLMAEAMSSVKAGDTVAVEFVRDGQTLHAEVKTHERGTYMAKVVEDERPWLEALQSLRELEDLEALQGLEKLEVLKDGKLDLSGNVIRVPAGLRLHDVGGDLARYFEVEQGVLVLDTPQGGQALKAGDILLEIDGEDVADADAALERLAKLQGSVPARVKRRGRDTTVALDVDALNADQALQVMGGDRRILIHRVGSGDKVRLEITVDD